MVTQLLILQELPGAEMVSNNNRACEDLGDECESDNPIENATKDFSGLTDIYWVSFFMIICHVISQFTLYGHPLFLFYFVFSTLLLSSNNDLA